MLQKIKKIIEQKFDEREKKVIKLRYGIDCEKAMTQKEVAEVLGISRSYISRIENKTLKIIKEEITNQEEKALAIEQKFLKDEKRLKK